MVKDKYYVMREGTFVRIKFEHIQNGDVIKQHNRKTLWRVTGKVFIREGQRTIIVHKFKV